MSTYFRCANPACQHKIHMADDVAKCINDLNTQLEGCSITCKGTAGNSPLVTAIEGPFGFLSAIPDYDSGHCRSALTFFREYLQRRGAYHEVTAFLGWVYLSKDAGMAAKMAEIKAGNNARSERTTADYRHRIVALCSLDCAETMKTQKTIVEGRVAQGQDGQEGYQAAVPGIYIAQMYYARISELYPLLDTVRKKGHQCAVPNRELVAALETLKPQIRHDAINADPEEPKPGPWCGKKPEGEEIVPLMGPADGAAKLVLRLLRQAKLNEPWLSSRVKWGLAAVAGAAAVGVATYFGGKALYEHGKDVGYHNGYDDGFTTGTAMCRPIFNATYPSSSTIPATQLMVPPRAQWACQNPGLIASYLKLPPRVWQSNMTIADLSGFVFTRYWEISNASSYEDPARFWHFYCQCTFPGSPYLAELQYVCDPANLGRVTLNHAADVFQKQATWTNQQRRARARAR